MTKEQLKKYHSSRGSWGLVNPVTKVIPNKKKQANKNQCRKKTRGDF